MFVAQHTGTCLLIAKYTGVNQAAAVARTGTWWALSVSDYDAIKAGGMGTSFVDLGLPVAVPEPGTGTLLLGGLLLLGARRRNS